MANVPQPQSYEQIIGNMLTTYLSKIGINDLNTGSAVTCFFEAMAQAVYRASGDIFQVLRDNDSNRATGEALQRLALDLNLTPLPSLVATGTVTVTDTSFNKISTKIYAGSNPPNIGSTIIKVSDASLFPATGSIYIGRGTVNIEGPIAYTSVTQVGTYYTIQLATQTTKYHNISEPIILSQGGARIIVSGSILQTVGQGSSAVYSYTTTQQAIILDGEVQITKVPIAAQTPGSDSNAPAGMISSFATIPFDGATVTNPLPLTTGTNPETDEELRVRIQNAKASKGVGTATAIQASVIGAQSKDDNATVTSSKIINSGTETVLYIDNGQGYEESTTGVGLEYIVDSALGGETYFQLATGGTQTSIAKAFLESTLTSPFSINPTDGLAVLVGGIASEHFFATGDFKTNGYATAYEVAASINGDSSISFSAQTAENGTKIMLLAQSETDEYLQVTTPSSGANAAIALGLTSNEVETLRLYKNRKPLSRNGKLAIIQSAEQSLWSNTIVTGETLILTVDNTAPITYTIVDADFITEGTQATVAQTNTLSSWINVFNSKITGVTATINGTTIELISNLGASARASVMIDPTSSLVTKGMFTSAIGLSTSGAVSDFILSRNTAQFKLSKPLSKGDSLTAGTQYTQGFIESSDILGGSVTVGSDAYLWFLIDQTSASIIKHGVTSDSVVTIAKQAGDTVRFLSNVSNAFVNAKVGDYVIIWSAELNAGNRLEGRICAIGQQVNPNDYFELRVTSAEYTAASNQVNIVFSSGLSIVRTLSVPQKVKLSAGTYDIGTAASILNNQLLGAYVAVEQDQVLVVTTATRSLYGSVLLVTFNTAATSLGFVAESSDDSISSSSAFYESANTDRSFPLFIHSYVTTDAVADEPNSFIGALDSAINLSGLDPSLQVGFLNPYLFNGSEIYDFQPMDAVAQIVNYSGSAINLENNPFIRRLRVGDRFYLLNALDLSYNDSLIAILDNDPVDNTFPIPLFRNGSANNTMAINANNFRAYDVDGGSVAFSTFFQTFDFSNFKVYMKARNVIDPMGGTDQDAILYRAATYGRSGEKIAISYEYPTSANTPITGDILISNIVAIKIYLKSGAPVVNNIDGTTQWDVTITPNTPVAGVDQVTYTWNTVGTSPSLGALVAGNYATINTLGEFSLANTGTFKVSSATASSFTVSRPSGAAISESNIATLQPTVISFYQSSDTTASDIVTYVNANLADWVSADILNDNGMTGSGIINASTYENSAFTSMNVQLVDGINWILSSDISAVAPAPNFIFKNALALPSYTTNTVNAYAFNNGESFILVPTTTDQVANFINFLAVTGFSTIGEINIADRGSKLQLGTQTLGSTGVVQITGGTANQASALVINNSALISGTDLMRTSVSTSGAAGFVSDQWVKLTASYKQHKETGIGIVTSVTIVPNSPAAGYSTVVLGQRENWDRYFGQPRNQFRDINRAFQVEKQGSLVCISWDGVTGIDPVFTKTVSIDADGGQISVSYDPNTGFTSYIVVTGSRNFCEVSIGDRMTISSLANNANNGTFNVVGISDDGFIVVTDNSDGVTASAAAVLSANLTFYTQIKEGDLVDIGTPFAIVNRGQFRVIRVFSGSIYIDNSTAEQERVVVVPNLRVLGFDGSTQFNLIANGNLKIQWNGNGTQPDLALAQMGDIVTLGTDFNAANRGSFMVTDSGSNYLTVANAAGITESNIQVTDVLTCHIPALKFHSYDDSVVNDYLNITGTVLGSANIGQYKITNVVNKNKVVVQGVLTSQSLIPLINRYTQVYVEEANAYVGYKKIYVVMVDPANSNQSILVFDTNNTYSKVNENAGEVLISAIGKFGFSEIAISGLDSYRYDTGLVAEVNKILYGDPRDPITYPGIAAAGAEIFVKPPLVRRIQISINVRVRTGVPFASISDQVRNSIAALINSSPIGRSIAISSIIASVNSIPGTVAVSITSPNYNATNDLIVVNPSEKPFILSITDDITVSKTGA